MDFSPEGQFRPPEPTRPYERVIESGQGIIPLTEFMGQIKAQMLLAAAAFPNEQSPMDLWVQDKAPGDSLASRFRAYIENPKRKPEELQLDPSKTAVFLELVRLHPPESIH